MAESVPLTFVPPIDPDIVALHVFESDNSITGFYEIQSVSAGTYPDYINRFVTTNANKTDDWFAIQWEDAEGVRTELSAPIKGGTATLVGDLVERVLLRASDLDENVVLQEVEATVEFVYKADPYTIDINNVSRLWLTELTNLALVAALYVSTIEQSSSTQGYTAGMISEQTNKNITVSLDGFDKLEKRALRRLGIGGSLLASIDRGTWGDYSVTGQKFLYDATRILLARATITQNYEARDIASGDYISPNVNATGR